MPRKGILTRMPFAVKILVVCITNWDMTTIFIKARPIRGAHRGQRGHLCKHNKSPTYRGGASGPTWPPWQQYIQPDLRGGAKGPPWPPWQSIQEFISSRVSCLNDLSVSNQASPRIAAVEVQSRDVIDFALISLYNCDDPVLD